MASLFRHRRTLFKNKTLDCIEEVGVDIADALDLLDIKKKSDVPTIVKKSSKIEKERFESEKLKTTHETTNKITKALDIIDLCPTLNHSPSLTRINHDFVQHLQNETQNSPVPSSASLSHWLRNPSMGKNILFRETVTTGHTIGEAQNCQIQLTPQVLTLVKKKHPYHVVIEDIQLVQLDEFQQICTIFSSNRLLTLENFPSGRLSKFLLTLGYLIHLIKPCKRIIYQFNWNFVLKRQKLPDVICVYPVTLSIEEIQSPKKKRLHKQKLKYKIDTFEDEVVVESFESETEWIHGYWVIKLNSLYLYEESYSDLPIRFWLLADVSALTILDDSDKNAMLEIAFENDNIILLFDQKQEMQNWFSMLENAQNFEADKYFTGEMVTEVKEVILVMDPTTLLTMNMNHKGLITKHNLLTISTISDMNLSSQKPECSLVIKKDVSETHWRLVFCQYSDSVKFVEDLKRLWKNK